MLRRRLTGTIFCLFAAFYAALAVAKDPAPAKTPARPAKAKSGSGAKFLRLSRDDKKQPLAMETAIVRYVVPEGEHKGVTIDLIGAVHIGEKKYYSDLNKEFEQYDALLYELVADDETKVPKNGKAHSSGHPIGMLQNGMKDMLGLEHQLQYIDYEKSNFVHADMSPDEFSKSMENRGESFWQMFFRMMGQSIAQQNKPGGKAMSDFDILMALFDNDRSVALKRLMAEQFEDLEGAMNAFEGPDGSTIITERNKVALKVLAEQIAAGKKRIGIFYGAGHMPDMEERLMKDTGARREGERWVAAWDLRDKPKAAPKMKLPKPKTAPPKKPTATS